jgi:hypothetical protein
MGSTGMLDSTRLSSSVVIQNVCLSTGCIIGYSLGYMNLLHNIAVYGTLCKELGIPMRCALMMPGAQRTQQASHTIFWCESCMMTVTCGQSLKHALV